MKESPIFDLEQESDPKINFESWIRIRPKVSKPHGSGSATLVFIQDNHAYSDSTYCGDFACRFGLIMSLVAKRDIEPGEEIYTSYNYDVQKAPVWYQVGNRCM